MQINNCYKKVKNNCFKFIKTQETKTNKFKNKNKMLKAYLIPLCFWINKKKKTFFIGLAGARAPEKQQLPLSYPLY